MMTSKIDYTDPKYEDPLEEVYAIRREISEQYGHDIHRLFEGLREWQREQEANGVKFNFAHLPIVRHIRLLAQRSMKRLAEKQTGRGLFDLGLFDVTKEILQLADVEIGVERRVGPVGLLTDFVDFHSTPPSTVR